VTEQEDHNTEADKRFAAARSSDVPAIYFNGFVTRLSTGDIAVALEQNGRPACMLNMSYTVAKTLSVSLSQAIARLEELSGRDMLTSTEIEKMVREEELGRGGDNK
jgi:hypothetical protein